MKNSTLKSHVEAECFAADESISKGNIDNAFAHLERAHVLGQSMTFEHTRVHWRMLKIGWKRRDIREILGQIFRVAGASTKTPFGIYPKGNTGGANVSPFRPMPIAADLAEILRSAENRKKVG